MTILVQQTVTKEEKRIKHNQPWKLRSHGRRVCTDGTWNTIPCSSKREAASSMVCILVSFYT